MFVYTLMRDMARYMAVQAGLLGAKHVWRERNGLDILKITYLKYFATRAAMKSPPTVLQKLIDNKAKYIYFPLHVTPEMTTSVMADKLTDQLNVIEQLSKRIPAGWKVVVKDHIPMIGRRSKDFMKRLSSLPDVIVTSPYENNFGLMKHAQTTATITGTGAWESMILGKVPVVMGDPYYVGLGEGFVKCPNPHDLGKAIETAMTIKPIEQKKLELFVASTVEETFEIPIGYLWFKEKIEDEKVQKIVTDFTDTLQSKMK